MAKDRPEPKDDDEPPLCCEVAELLQRWRPATDHLASAKREILLFIKAVVDKELETLDEPPVVARRRRKVPIRQV